VGALVQSLVCMGEVFVRVGAWQRCQRCGAGQDALEGLGRAQKYVIFITAHHKRGSYLRTP
jgi:hypothetical protein